MHIEAERREREMMHKQIAERLKMSYIVRERKRREAELESNDDNDNGESDNGEE